MSRRSNVRARRQRRRGLRDNRARSDFSGDRELVDLESELYAELGYDMVTGSFAIPSRFSRSGRRLSSSEGSPGV